MHKSIIYDIIKKTKKRGEERNIKMNILIVEDDIYIGNLIEELLKDKYNVYRAYSGSEALLMFQHHSFDLVLLDLMLPGLEGEEVLKQIRGKTKVIVISAKTSKHDKVSNLMSGANDYITKPFDNDELLARIEVQLRETRMPATKIVQDEITVNLDTMEAFVNGHELKLTKLEFGILVFLMRNPNRVFSRSQIFEAVWDEEAIGNEDSVKVHISNIRKKIAQYTDKKYIDTVWGIGFKFNA